MNESNNEVCDLYVNGRVFTADDPPWAGAFVVREGRFDFVGNEADARGTAGPHAHVVDLNGALVLPGLVDGHAHVVMTGEAGTQADLWGADDLGEIQSRIRTWADEHPSAPRVMAQGWIHSAIPGGRPTREQLDVISSSVPIYAHSYDYHSMWLNTAALAEMGVTAQTEAPAGGGIARDPAGEPSGLVTEAAMEQLIWPRLEAFVGTAERAGFVAAALQGYRSCGITAATDMSLTEAELDVLQDAERSGELTIRVRAYWRIEHQPTREANLAQIARAAQAAQQQHSHLLAVVGVKIFVDGTIDGCTAALRRPYADGTNADPLWHQAELDAVVSAADAAGLAIAIHAIGDEAVGRAVTAIEHAIEANGSLDRHHRIEHLEVVAPEDIARMARSGIVASVQPVHADPAIQDNWRRMLGDARVDRGFPWSEFTSAGVPLVFGSDSPTAPYHPLRNLYVATTRQSALKDGLAANSPQLAVAIEAGVLHFTRDAARACGAEDLFGRIARDLAADFVVLDRDIFSCPPEALLNTSVIRTVLGGRPIYPG